MPSSGTLKFKQAYNNPDYYEYSLLIGFKRKARK
jgi:hypothetical protein